MELNSLFWKIIGIIREKKQGDKLFLSWALLKKFRGKNYGTGLIKEFLKSLFSEFSVCSLGSNPKFKFYTNLALKWDLLSDSEIHNKL